MQRKGLGDDIENFFKKTGVKTVVDKVTEGLNTSLFKKVFYIVA